MTRVCAHYIVERLEEISKKIEEDIKLNPDVDVFSDILVEDLRHELIFNMGVDAHNSWKEGKK